MTGRDIAIEYLEAGWHPLPLPPFEKASPPGGTTGYSGRDLTRNEIEHTDWRGNIGVRMPPWVIGLDVDGYRGGNETLAEMQSRLGELPPTYVSHSNRSDGSGIRFYVVPQGFGWVTTLPGIDIIQRGHRYAVVWPSLHPEGRAYAWLDQTEPEVQQDSPPLVDDLPELPWAWFEELSRPEQDAPTQAVDFETSEGFLEDFDQADAPGYFRDKVIGDFVVKVAAGGSRHDAMQHALTWAMECVRARLIDGKSAVKELHEAWQHQFGAHERKRVTSGEFDAMLRHAIGKVIDRPNDEFDVMHDEIAGPRFEVSSPAAAAIDGYQPAEGAQEGAQELASGIQPINWMEFIQRDTSAQSWLAEGFWPWGRAMALWASAKTGKSELILWVAVKLALGEHPWTDAPLDPIDVAYFDYEMTPDDLDDRLVDFDVDPRRLEHLHYFQLPPMYALDTEKGGAQLEELVAGVSAQAVVIDTFGRSVDGDENEADTVRSFARHTGLRLKAMGVGYVRTDHAGKDVTKGQRGSSAKRDDVDVVWRQLRTTDGALLDCAGSSRLSWVGPELRLERTVTNDVVAYRTPVTMGVSAAAIAKANEIDGLGLPGDAGRPAVIKALLDAGLKQGKSTTLNEAIKIRKERAERAERLGTPREQLPDSPTPSSSAEGNSSGNSSS